MNTMNHTDIRLIFECVNGDCDELPSYEWNPEDLVSSGTPVCEHCDHDCEYVGWREVDG